MTAKFATFSMSLILFMLMIFIASPAYPGITITYKGFVVAGYDQTGLFGDPNTTLTGDAFTLVVSTDGTQIDNGSYYSAVATDAALTISGNTYNIPVSNVTFMFLEPNSLGEFSAGTNVGPNNDLVTITAFSPSVPSTLDTSFSYNLGPPKYPLYISSGPTGGLFVDNQEGTDGFTNYAYLQSAIDGGVGPLAPFGEPIIPEPSIWTLMLLGLGWLGIISYRQRRTVHC
jgi:hypothetical protein